MMEKSDCNSEEYSEASFFFTIVLCSMQNLGICDNANYNWNNNENAINREYTIPIYRVRGRNLECTDLLY